MGGRPPDTTDREILLVFSKSNDPVLSTAEVAETLSYSANGTYKRLEALDEEGLLSSKFIGDSKAWWITEDGKQFLRTEREFTSEWEEIET